MSNKLNFKYQPNWNLIFNFLIVFHRISIEKILLLIEFLLHLIDNKIYPQLIYLWKLLLMCSVIEILL